MRILLCVIMCSLCSLAGADEYTLAPALQDAAEEALSGMQGSLVLMDMQGRVLALGGSEQDAIAHRGAPGEPFQIITALAALANSNVTLEERISDGGAFDLYSYENPVYCWLDQNRLNEHADLGAIEAVSRSCYYSSYALAARLGADGEALHAFAEKIGLVGLTNIELAGEAPSIVGGQKTLFDPFAKTQDTDIPARAEQNLYGILADIRDKYALECTDETLAVCARELMAMAYYNETGYDYEDWKNKIAATLVDRLGVGWTPAFEIVWDEGALIIGELTQIKWAGTHTTQASIGQSITAVTPVSMARLMVTVANGGRIYDASILRNSATESKEPIRVLRPELETYLSAVRKGLRGVVDVSGQAAQVFADWPYVSELMSITGFGYGNDPNGDGDAWYVGLAPWDTPEIAFAVHIAGGDDAVPAMEAAKAVLDAYFAQ